MLASSHMVKIHRLLKPAAVPSSIPGCALSVCTAGFPSKVLCTAPSLAYLTGKSLYNAASEGQIPITYRESKCLHL